VISDYVYVKQRDTGISDYVYVQQHDTVISDYIYVKQRDTVISDYIYVKQRDTVSFDYVYVQQRDTVITLNDVHCIDGKTKNGNTFMLQAHLQFNIYMCMYVLNMTCIWNNFDSTI